MRFTMKTLSVLVLGGFLMSLMVFRNADSAEVASRPRAATAPSAPVDPTELVVSFYKALLQDTPPTLQQEKELFHDGYNLHNFFLKNQKDLKVTDTDPVILTLFRKHKELFLPRNEDKPLTNIHISSPFNFVRNLERPKGKREDSYVLAMFNYDKKAESSPCYTVVFQIINGRIEPAGICFGGFEGETILNKFMK